MTTKPFHHGTLREDLLQRARITLRAGGQDGLSLRQLARDAGVSHGAPRRHFAERQDLLDALAERGFEDLTTSVLEQVGGQVDGDAETFRAVARAYIGFAIEDAALMDLMFATKSRPGADPVARAADRFFATVGSLVRAKLSAPAPGVDAAQLQLLLAATLHGIASLVAAGRLSADQVDGLISDAGVLFGAATRGA